MRRLMNFLTASCASFALAMPAATIITVVSADAAAAERGGNGNGNGRDRSRGNSGNRDSASRGNSGNRGNANRERTNNGRGAIARELGSLNAAHASRNGLANSDPGSMTGKLYTYQQAILSMRTLEDEVKRTGDLYNALSNMTEAQFVELNPTLDYAQTLNKAGTDYQNALNSIGSAEADAESSLYALTGGRRLSNEAMTELHALLGL